MPGKRGYPGAIAKLRLSLAADRRVMKRCSRELRELEWDHKALEAWVTRLNGEVRGIRNTVSDLVDLLKYGR